MKRWLAGGLAALLVVTSFPVSSGANVPHRADNRKVHSFTRQALAPSHPGYRYLHDIENNTPVRVTFSSELKTYPPAAHLHPPVPLLSMSGFRLLRTAALGVFVVLNAVSAVAFTGPSHLPAALTIAVADVPDAPSSNKLYAAARATPDLKQKMELLKSYTQQYPGGKDIVMVWNDLRILQQLVGDRGAIQSYMQYLKLSHTPWSYFEHSTLQGIFRQTNGGRYQAYRDERAFYEQLLRDPALSKDMRRYFELDLQDVQLALGDYTGYLAGPKRALSSDIAKAKALSDAQGRPYAEDRNGYNGDRSDLAGRQDIPVGVYVLPGSASKGQDAHYFEKTFELANSIIERATAFDPSLRFSQRVATVEFNAPSLPFGDIQSGRQPTSSDLFWLKLADGVRERLSQGGVVAIVGDFPGASIALGNGIYLVSVRGPDGGRVSQAQLAAIIAHEMSHTVLGMRDSGDIVALNKVLSGRKKNRHVLPDINLRNVEGRFIVDETIPVAKFEEVNQLAAVNMVAGAKPALTLTEAPALVPSPAVSVPSPSEISDVQIEDDSDVEASTFDNEGFISGPHAAFEQGMMVSMSPEEKARVQKLTSKLLSFVEGEFAVHDHPRLSMRLDKKTDPGQLIRVKTPISDVKGLITRLERRRDGNGAEIGDVIRFDLVLTPAALAGSDAELSITLAAVIANATAKTPADTPNLYLALLKGYEQTLTDDSDRALVSETIAHFSKTVNDVKIPDVDDEPAFLIPDVLGGALGEGKLGVWAMLFPIQWLGLGSLARVKRFVRRTFPQRKQFILPAARSAVLRAV